MATVTFRAPWSFIMSRMKHLVLLCHKLKAHCHPPTPNTHTHMENNGSWTFSLDFISRGFIGCRQLQDQINRLDVGCEAPGVCILIRGKRWLRKITFFIEVLYDQIRWVHQRRHVFTINAYIINLFQFSAPLNFADDKRVYINNLFLSSLFWGFFFLSLQINSKILTLKRQVSLFKCWSRITHQILFYRRLNFWLCLLSPSFTSSSSRPAGMLQGPFHHSQLGWPCAHLKVLAESWSVGLRLWDDGGFCVWRWYLGQVESSLIS